jgi:glyoxylase-like metal-dependent hydrolase (beta-lactamase superfamily II)
MFSNCNFFVKKFINPIFQSNSYIIYSKTNKIIAIIDPGETIIENINCKNINIILTHEHVDHIYGLEQLCNNNLVTIFLSEKCHKNINDPKKNLSEYISNYKINKIIPKISNIVKDNDIIKINNIDFKFYITPGHSEGGICIGFDKYIFTGDTFMETSKIITNLPGGSKEQLKNTNIKLKSILDHYEFIFPGHGDIFVKKNQNL